MGATSVRRVNGSLLLATLGLFSLAVSRPAEAAATARALVPPAAPIGARVVVIGSGLDAPGLAVSFTGPSATSVPAPVITTTPTLLEIAVPVGAQSGPVTITTTSATIASFSFTVSGSPHYPRVATLAGQSTQNGDRGGEGDDSKKPFKEPATNVVLTSQGLTYVADTKHHQIRVVTASGQVSVTAGTGKDGFKDGPRDQAQFKEPKGLALDRTNLILYIADTGNNRIRKLTSDGVVSTIAGSDDDGAQDGPGKTAQFTEPSAIALDPSGNLVVADTGNNKIRLVTPSGAVTTLAGNGKDGFVDGPVAQARFKEPRGIVVSPSGAIYVADSGNHAIRKIAGGTVSTVAGKGHDGVRDGAISQAEFDTPAGLDLDEEGSLLVAESGNNDLRKISFATSTVSTIAGGHNDGFVDGPAAQARFKEPSGIAVAGAIYVADTKNDAIRILYPDLKLTELYPRRGPLAGGNQIRIFGMGFVPGATTVKFGTVAGTNVTIVTSTELLVTVPAGSAGAADVTITTPGGSSTLAGAYAYLNPPTVTTVTPGKGKTAGGESVTVRGSEFVDGDTRLLFGQNDATGLSVTGTTRIDATTPGATSAGSVDVTVKTPGGQSSLTNGFTYCDPPTVTAVNPTQGKAAGGYTVTITGTNFVEGATLVNFGSTAATGIVVSGTTSLTATVPAGAPGAVDVAVTTPGGTATLAGAFTYLNPPTVTNISPAAGKIAGGATVTITGTNFSTTNTTVTFGTVSATNVAVASPTSLTAVAPAGVAGTADVSVTTSGGTATLPAAFTYLNPPTATAITPTEGKTAGGATVTITGTNFFSGNTTVTFGGVSATNVTLAGTTSLTATVPVGTAGIVDVVVSTPGGSATLPGAFSYLNPPTITAISPSQGKTVGGTSVTVTGTNFSATNTTVTFGTAPGTNVVVTSAMSLTATVPAGTAGAVDVVVTTAGGTATSTAAFMYVNPPTLTAVNPTQGKTVGGSTVTVTGTNFTTTGTSVSFGSAAATNVTVPGPTSLTATLPAGTAGVADVSVTTLGGSATLPAAFTYFNPPTVTSVSPAQGVSAGGYAVTISGSNFVAGSTSVAFGANPATSIAVTSSSSLTAVVPAGASGPTDVSVTTPGGIGTLPASFTYFNAPTITGINPAQGKTSGGYSVTVTGSNFAAAVTQVSFGPAAAGVVVSSSTSLTATVPAGSPGQVNVAVTTPGGTATLPNGFLYLTPPSITGFAPASGQVGTSVTITGTAFDPTPAKNAATFNGTPAAVTGASATQLVAVVPTGASSGPISITTNGGTAASQTVFVVVTRVATSVTVSTPVFSILTGQSQQFTATATFDDGTSGDVTAQAAWATSNSTVSSVAGGLVTGIAAGSATITASVGSTSGTAAVSVSTPTTIPPDPSLIAPPVDATVASTTASSTQFLYTGSNPIQTAVTAGAISVQSAGLIRGKVLSRDGTALPGATIRVVGHAELGSTLSRLDGTFDLVVNAGGPLTLEYSKPGYLSAQRSVTTLWQDTVTTADVVLVPYDNAVTAVAAGASAPQVARGSLVTDADGARQATLLFVPGTQATMTLPGGATQALSTLHVRATEFTVGTSGPNAMPGELPPQSGYTYAAEFSVDEADAQRATRVDFSAAVVTYVDNFVGFPVGNLVPAGYYDRQLARWVAAPDGRVIKILGVTLGLADLDTNGDGVVDSSAVLATQGITDAERQQLAALYQPGKTLWRVPITHFTAWDFNWNLRLPPGTLSPPGQRPKPPRPAHPSPRCGSIIGCQTQSLSEVLPVTGTPFTLAYNSERSLGHRSTSTLDITISDDSLPGSVTRMDLDIDVAGQHVKRSFSPQKSVNHSFDWDGRDGYGRPFQGTTTATIKVSYAYRGLYSSSPYAVAASFGRVVDEINAGGATSFNVMRSTGEITLSTTARVPMTSWDSRPPDSLGGWSLSAHHSYDPSGRILYLGDGTVRSIEGQPATEDQVAANLWTNGIAAMPDGGFILSETVPPAVGIHSIRRYDQFGNKIAEIAHACCSTDRGNDIPANSTDIKPKNIALGPDGSIYVAESFRIRRIDPTGFVRAFAGTGTGGARGDGGPATQAAINNLVGSSGTAGPFGVGPDGSVYFTENAAVRRVAPDGIITTVAGGPQGFQVGGHSGYSPDGTKASDAKFQGLAGVAIAPDGTLYLLDAGDTNSPRGQVRKIGKDGLLATVAGCFTCGTVVGNGDGFAATDAPLPNLAPVLALAPDGSVLIGQNGDCGRIRQISPQGIISTLAGTPCPAHVTTSTFTNGTPAQQAIVAGQLTAIAPTPDGSFLFGGIGGTETAFPGNNAPGANTVRRIGSSLPGIISVGSFRIAAEDGSEIYIFDPQGRHLQTLNALTGALVLQFAYDSAGRLKTITDGDGNLTTIQRDGQGNATAIAAPGGQTTSLRLDGNGYLSSVANPASETVSLTNSSQGLLTDLYDPKNQHHHFDYNLATGRLAFDTDPAGGSQTLARTDIPNGYDVAVTTALSRLFKYRVENLPNGDEKRTNTDPAGFPMTTTRSRNETRVITAPDGTVTTVTETPDPRWGMQAPYLGTVSVKTPSGLTLSSSASSSIALGTQGNPLSLSSETITAKLNGRTYGATYNASTQTTTTTSPLGRIYKRSIDLRGRILGEQLGSLLPVAYSYDSKGRLSTITQGTGAAARILTIGYDPGFRATTLTDPLNRLTTLGYDNADRATLFALPGNREIGLGFDANGNISSLTPPGQPLHLFSYTPNDLEATYTAPPIGSEPSLTTLGYDSDRALATYVQPDGLFASPTYDAGGRLSTIQTSLGNYAVSYDPASGNPATLQDPEGGSLAFVFDGFLPTSVSLSGSVAGSLGVTWDSDFRISNETINGGASVAFGYDGDGLLTQAGSLALSRDTQTGLLSSTVLGNVTDTTGYNAFGEPVTYIAKYAGTPVFSQTFTRDNLGRIATLADTLAGVTDIYAYAYDAAGRLQDVTKNSVLLSHYDYDTNGNRLKKTDSTGTVSGTYDAQDRLTQYGNATYTYTASGDLRSRTQSGNTDTFTYDVMRNLKIALLATGARIDYVTDALGRRVGKKRNGTVVQGFIYRSGLRPAAELDGTGAMISRFVYGAGVNVPAYVVRGGITYRIVTDHLGSPRVVIDVATGNIAQRMDYDEFGNVTLDSNPGFQPFGFAGGLYDSETGLVRFGTRDYDAKVGRWCSKDHLRFAGGFALLYQYVNGDPINFFDPSGTWALKLNFYYGWGGSVTLGSQDGEPFVRATVGFGLSAGVKYYPVAGFQVPTGGYCGRRGYIGFSGSGSVAVGPLSGELGGYGGLLIYDDLEHHTRADSVRDFGPKGSVKPSSGVGLSLGVNVAVDAGVTFPGR